MGSWDGRPAILLMALCGGCYQSHSLDPDGEGRGQSAWTAPALAIDCGLNCSGQPVADGIATAEGTGTAGR